MHDDLSTQHAGQAVVKQRQKFSIIWLIPLLTLCIGVWLIIKTINEKGTEITITFATAEGIEAGKTVIKYKDVNIGVVKSLKFGHDYKHVILTARIKPEAESLLHRDSRFWVVRPQLSLRGASGLGTLISGSYLEIDPGFGVPQDHFTGLNEAPIIHSDETGMHVTLLAEKLGSLDIGSPVYYQGIQAGEVLGYELSNDKHSIFVHAFIHAPYDDLVHGNSHFWNVSGINISVGADGFQLQTSSLQSMIYGGVAFDSSKYPEAIDDDAENLVFTLFEHYDDIVARSFTRKIRFVVFFDGSVRGLNIGAPVEFKGIQVGVVKGLSLKFDQSNSSFRIPVVIEIEPERIVESRPDNEVSAVDVLQSLVERGLRAQLQTGSLLTGKLYIALDMHPNSPIRLLANKATVLPEIPSIAGEFDQITTSLQHILAKLEKVPTDKMGEDIAALLHSGSALLKSPEAHESIDDLQETLRSFKHVIAALDQHAEPMANNLNEVLSSGRKTLEQAEITLRNINATLDPASPLQYRVNQLSQDLSDMAQSIRSFVDLLERHPNAVIFGKPQSGD